MRKQLYLFIFVAFCTFFVPAKAEISLPAILSDNMVLQQNSKVNLWGKATPSEKIEIAPSWSKTIYKAVADVDGNWKVQIQTPAKQSKSESISLKGKNKLLIKNILIGEVWLCSGQSNMDFPIAKATRWRTGVINEKEALADADYPEIRLFHVVQQLSPGKELDNCQGKWEVCNAENIREFSAVAFFFGRSIFQHIKTPVGLIQSSWGGTPAEAWTKFSVIEKDPIYADLLKDFREKETNYPNDIKKYETDLEVYNAARAKGDSTLKAPKKPQGNNHNKALSILWNGMIHPLLPYTIKGVIWYQGESNAIRYWNYAKAFSNMVSSWRNEWGEGDFPFYFVQIAPQYKQPAGIREAQLNAWKNLKNSGMVVITDVGDSTNIHPRNKQVVGERLAAWALAKNYNEDISYSGPLYRSMQVNKDKAYLSFDYTDGGLSSKGKKLIGFEVAGEDKIFHPGNAVIEGNKVVVSAPEVSSVKSIRYAWGKFFRANLFNGAGLPASPFRTDDWKLEFENLN